MNSSYLQHDQQNTNKNGKMHFSIRVDTILHLHVCLAFLKKKYDRNLKLELEKKTQHIYLQHKIASIQTISKAFRCNWKNSYKATHYEENNYINKQH